MWIQDGTRYVGEEPRNVRKKLEKLERAGDHWKGLGLSVLRPDMIQTMWWDLIGGKVGSARVPDVRWGGRPKFPSHWVDDAHPGFRALVSGSEFTVA